MLRSAFLDAIYQLLRQSEAFFDGLQPRLVVPWTPFRESRGPDHPFRPRTVLTGLFL